MVPRRRLALKRGTIATDRLTAGFAATLGAVVVARAGQSPAWPGLLLAVALLFVLLALLAAADPDTPLLRFVGPCYPLLLVSGLYGAIGVLNADAGVNHDLWAQRLEQLLFGGQISLTWHHRWPGAVVSWILHLCYVSYYPIVVGVGLWHWRRTARPAFERAVFTLALCFYVCYAAFLLFPVAGPRYFFGAATGPAAETLPGRFANDLLAAGSAYGTAFPSSHIAVTLCAVAVTWPNSRRLAAWLAVPAAGLAISTVYGQFHYAVDAIAGVLTAALVLVAAGPLYRMLRRGD